MGKRQADGTSTFCDAKKPRTHEVEILVPDTPQSQMKKRGPLQPSRVSTEASCLETTPVKPPRKKTCSGEGSSDQFSDDDIDYCALDEIEDTVLGYWRYSRLKVISVDDWEDDKVVRCISEDHKKEVELKVEGEWYYSDITPDSFIHVIAETHPLPQTVEISNCNSTMMIIHPDILISPTTISSSVRCLRQAVLGEVFKPTVGFSSNEVMLIGTINHAVFDAALRSQKFEQSYLRQQLNSILKQEEILTSLCCLNLSQDDILKKVLPCLEHICSWGRKYCGGGGAVVSYGQKGNEMTKIHEVLDIEENIWSPKYGCKGKVDATVRIHTTKASKISPVEVKSGLSKSTLGSIDHRAQVILYTMMLEERYRETVDSGVLYYIRGKQTIGVPSSAVERRALVIKRNDVATAIHDILKLDQMKLPELTKEKMTCNYCDHQLSCSLAFKSFEGRDPSTHPNPEILENNTAGITDAHLAYFQKFSKLCIQESRCKTAKMPWVASCPRLDKLTLDSVSTDHGFLHKFTLSQPITHRHVVATGDYVIVSKVDGSAYNICAGFVTSLSASHLELYVRDVDLRASPHHKPGPCYNITPHSSLAGLHTSLGNVTSLMGKSERAEKWRKLIIDEEKPNFTKQLHAYSNGSQDAAEKDLLASLNKEQKYAVERALATQDYLCILGMPGSGKTTTISCLVEVLVARGFSVLLTAYTHSAVDNLVMKLPQQLDLVRLGAPGRIHAANKHRSAHALTSSITDPQLLRTFYQNKAVIATTCLGMRDSVFEYKRFDFCIIDEASQITQPICLGPILHSDRCILVGDHHQLPPLVQSKIAQQQGLDVSLFKKLTEAHPTAGVCHLATQYRMCTDVMLLANTLVYDGRLKCGNEAVARSILNLSCSPDLLPRWIKKCLARSTKVLFLDTSKLGSTGYETELSTGSIANNLEAGVVENICKSLTDAGVEGRSIGVLAPYNGQLELLSGRIPPDIELLTADRFQGRDKPCILISFTRSNEEGNVGMLLRDKCRLNVALTRAKSKLLMVGNLATLSHEPGMLQELHSILESKGWIWHLEEADL